MEQPRIPGLWMAESSRTNLGPLHGPERAAPEGSVRLEQRPSQQGPAWTGGPEEGHPNALALCEPPRKSVPTLREGGEGC